jgi:hypothetical protein
MSPHNENLRAGSGRIATLITIATLVLLLALPGNAGRRFRGSDIITANGIGTPLDISTGSMTVSAWFYPTAVSGSEEDIVAHYTQPGNKGNQWLLSIGGAYGSSTNVQWFVGGSFTSGGCGTVTPNKWYFVILVIDKTGKYSGGSPSVGEAVYGGITCSSGQALSFDDRLPGGSNFTIGGTSGVATFKGYIAEVGVWNDVLSPIERTALAGGVSPASVRRSSLVGYFPLYGAKSPEPDYSGNKDNGVLTGAPKAPHCPCEFPMN